MKMKWTSLCATLLVVALGGCLLTGCVEGAIQVGPREWPSWMQDNPFSTITPSTQPASAQEKTIREMIEEKL